MVSSFANGAASLSFDDGWRCSYENALPVLDQAGLKSTHYIISGCLDDEQFPRYMNADQIRDLGRRGHEIGSHTASHKHLPTETESIIEDEIMLSRRYLERLVGPVETFTYPYGEYDDRVVAVVKRAGFLGARSVHDGLNGEGVDPFLLKCKAVKASTTVPEVRKWIDSARHRHSWLILMFHQIDHEKRAYSATPEMLAATARYLVDTGVPVITVRDGVKRLIARQKAVAPLRRG